LPVDVVMVSAGRDGDRAGRTRPGLNVALGPASA